VNDQAEGITKKKENKKNNFLDRSVDAIWSNFYFVNVIIMQKIFKKTHIECRAVYTVSDIHFLHTAKEQLIIISKYA
jgi:hypothetical protein